MFNDVLKHWNQVLIEQTSKTGSSFRCKHSPGVLDTVTLVKSPNGSNAPKGSDHSVKGSLK